MALLELHAITYRTVEREILGFWLWVVPGMIAAAGCHDELAGG